MKYNKQLTVADMSRILLMSKLSVTRIAVKPKKESKHEPRNVYDPTFPTIEKIGSSSFVNESDFYKWLSAKAGEEVTPEDELMNNKDMMAHYQKSHTWIWQRVKSKDIPSPFRINRSRLWIKRKVAGVVQGKKN